ncbi:type IV secretory system conjugative DNA transfer family protein [Anthocerotibacter panamensis]|uniref:type IV secretory system conjugative DNA transfer family protein n=1 Tax=Anthocerotibacter panamensis TaxID=2857077 RepID=UPI001C404AA7|nr:type IV secretion system DNA-binding domain-containing protein [Anthocerotibacter panamensis]
MNALLNFLQSQNGLLLIGCVFIFGALAFFSPKKSRLARGRFSTNLEKNRARSLAFAQIKARKHNAITLYAGKPQRDKDPKPLYLPDSQRGIAVVGGPGSGKTFSIIDPVLRSAVDQGFPVLLYDFKYPTQTARIAGYAREAGYDVRIFAPGYPESEVCNPLDFLRDPTDAETARQMAVVMNKNFKLAAQSTEDAFFSAAGDQLAEAIFLLAKDSPYPDVMMCQALLSVDQLPERLLQANLNPWVRSSFGQLLSVAKSEKTVASIIATANAVFTRFMKPSILGAFCGTSTLPLDLSGKQLLVLGLDRERRDVVGPLLATILHLVVTRNVVKRRTDPLVLALDELPTLYLPALVQWLNENREDGLACILGFQNLVQLEKAYGKELARALLGGCATKAVFNPQEYDSARMFSDFLGEEEINYKQKSRGSSAGKASNNLADQDRTRKLFEPSQFLKLPSGRCIFINPGYGNGKEASVPMEQQVRIPQTDLRRIAASEKTWEQLRQQLSQRNQREAPTARELELRFQAADALLPAAKSAADSAGRSSSSLDTRFESRFGKLL